MTPEDAIQIADDVLLAHAGNPLTDIQRMILRESLAGKGYERMEGYAPQHIKNEGKKLWDLLSEALGETVSKKNFKGALEKRLKSGGMVPKPPQPLTYDRQTWVGRESVVGDLLPKLQGHTRLLWITGMSGIGKTALGECLASQAWEHDPSFHWIYLEILSGQSPDFASVAAELLAKLGDRDLNPQERNNPEQVAKRLLHKLQAQPYWIQLDALERLLNPEQPNEFVDPYWATFLQRCLTEANLASRLVLTAQAFPTALVELSDRYPNGWAELRLGGLSEVEQRLEFFAKRGVVVETADRDILTRIAQIYEGHPLVLKVIAEDILQEFAGDVGRYWQVYQPEFEQVARELQATHLDETDYNEALDCKVRERIKQSLVQLPVDALDLLCRSAVFRRPVPKKFWLAMIGDRTAQQQKAAYRVLSDRALIEKEGTDIRQHNLIRDVAYDLLKADSLTWETAERQAAHLWLTAYEPAPDAPNLETVRGYLEAFEHYCEVEDWDTASEIYTQNLATTNQVLHWQLFIWANYQELVQISARLVEEISNAKIICLVNLGNSNSCLGNPNKAIEWYEKTLSAVREIGNHRGEGITLGNLGIAYYSLGQYERAIDCYQQALTISREIGNRDGEGSALGNLGLAYYSLGQYERAHDCHQQHLTIAREIRDHHSEGNALGNLGIVYYGLGNYERSIDYYRQYLNISREIGDRAGESRAIDHLGLAYYSLENYEWAIDYCQQALIISREIGNRRGEGVALTNIGAAQLRLEQYSESLTNNQAALDIFREIGDRANEAEALKQLAELHQALGEVEMAGQYCQQALALTMELGIPLQEECEALQLKINNAKLEMDDGAKDLSINQEVD